MSATDFSANHESHIRSARGEALDRLLAEGHVSLDAHVRALRIAAAHAINARANGTVSLKGYCCDDMRNPPEILT